MSNAMTITLVLAGHYAGQTVELNHHQFIDGELVFTGNAEQIISLCTYMRRCYNAHLKGSDDLVNAQKLYDIEMEKVHGEHYISGQDRAGAHAIETGIQSEREGTEEVSSVFGNTDVETESGDSGVRADGDGLQDSGDDDRPLETLVKYDAELEKAVRSLNPSVDSFWTKSGLVKLSSVQDMGFANATRKDIEAAVPNFNREIALAEWVDDNDSDEYSWLEEGSE